MSESALVSVVEPGSPAHRCGIAPNCVIRAVDGMPLRDVIDWRWIASEDRVRISFADSTGNVSETVMEREFGEDWGISFADALFEPAHQCVNACTFCFMRQLPAHCRPSLRFRDDDYRLSFLQGNFVTFTNMSDDHVRRIVEQHLSPLRFSLHAVTGSVRAELMGPRQARGLEVAELLLENGIQLHAQIVLVPGSNDGPELDRTLSWAYDRSGIVNVGIVPLGFTRYQDRFTRSYEQPQDALRVIRQVEPYRKRAMEERGEAWVHPADEFYCNAYPDAVIDCIPSASSYGDFGMFEDGIGMVRSFVDDFRASGRLVARAAEALRLAGAKCLFVHGRAQDSFFPRLVASSALDGFLFPVPVDNCYFGGNVTVTGLLAGEDIARVLRAMPSEEGVFAVLPSVVFNHDGLTVDDWTIADIASAVSFPVHVVSCQPSAFLPEIVTLAHEHGGGAGV